MQQKNPSKNQKLYFLVNYGGKVTVKTAELSEETDNPNAQDYSHVWGFCFNPSQSSTSY